MRRLKCILLSILIILTTAMVIKADEGFTADIDISDLLDDFEVVDISLKTPAFSDMTLVNENENIKLYFDEKGLDIYVVSSGGKIWSNVITEEYYSQAEASPNIFSQLLTVTACGADEAVNEYVLYDSSNSDIKAESSIENEELILNIAIDSIGLELKVIFGIKDDGFYYYIPDKDIKEIKGKIISISVLQNFGASRNDENGYILYPDGSGGIVRFKKSKEATASLNQLSIYGNSDVTYLQMERNWEDRIYGALLPVFGVSQTKEGFVAIIDKGAADAKINIAMPGYQIADLYRVYISYNYRTFSSTEFNKTTISSLVKERTKVDRKCYYYLISDNSKNNYSGMANRYREFLIENGTFKNTVKTNNLPLSLNLLCGVQKAGIFSSTLQEMTDFGKAEEIADWFNKNNVKDIDLRLSGWAKGGWDTLPTNVSAEGKLGGKSQLKKLFNYCKDNGIDLSLDVEPILANSETGEFNARKEAARNYFGDFFVDKTNTKYVLNAAKVLDSMYSKFAKSYNGMGLNLLTVGKLVYPDYNSKDVATSQEIIDAYIYVMKKAEKDKIRVSASTGNGYILPYADMIYSLPQEDSGYVFTSESVPFYQMVIHGYIPYTGEVGNSHYDFNRCILEWVETGSIPSFTLTYEDTSKLLETNYNDVFSSEFSVWNKKILDTYKRLNSDFSKLQNVTISSHEKLQNKVSKLTYANGSKVYVNYNSKEVVVEGNKIGAKDYLIVGE